MKPFALLFFLLPALAAAAPASPAHSEKPGSIAAGLLGQWSTHPGLFAQAERVAISGGHQVLVLGARMGAYTHPGNHHGLFGLGEATYRVTWDAGPFAEVGIGLGALQSVVAGPVYVARDNAVVVRADSGRTSLMPVTGLGVGWDFHRSHHTPWRFFLRGDGTLRLPVNRTILPGFFISLGLAKAVDWSDPF